MGHVLSSPSPRNSKARAARFAARSPGETVRRRAESAQLRASGPTGGDRAFSTLSEQRTLDVSSPLSPRVDEIPSSSIWRVRSARSTPGRSPAEVRWASHSRGSVLHDDVHDVSAKRADRAREARAQGRIGPAKVDGRERPLRGCGREAARERGAAAVKEELRLRGDRHSQHFAMVALGFATGWRPSMMRPRRRKGPRLTCSGRRTWCWQDGHRLAATR